MSFIKFPGNKIFIWLVVALFCGLFQRGSYVPLAYSSLAEKDTSFYVAPAPVLFYGFPAKEVHVEKKRVKRNQRFIDLLKGYYVAPRIMQQLYLLNRNVFDFRKVVAKKEYTLIVSRDDSHALKALIYESSAIDYVVFHLEDSLLVEKCKRKVIYKEKEVAGIIQSSLYETIEALDISPVLTNRFVDIFAWQIDFQRLQKGDLFKLIYEERLVGGRPYGIGRIKGIYFDYSGHGYCAVPFDQGSGLDYFDTSGKSLHKALLKYPIEFTRISSRYTRRRFHPVAKAFRAHLGTDFAAPMGTPIRAAGDGIVLEARHKVYNGNYVKIRHTDTYTTQYLHMSRIASGIRKGVRVHRGQTIGFVGKTGLATGPHLCYRFWKNNIQVDALTVKLPSSAPIKDRFKPAFQETSKKVLGRLDSIADDPS